MRSIQLSRARLEALLAAVPGVKAAVIGDVCVDAYWMADMRLSQLSRETPHHNLPIVEEKYALGGAGNVMNNMRALGAAVTPVTALGVDFRGDIARRLMREAGLEMDCAPVFEGRVTPCYVKPYRMGYGGVRYEDPRIDFENREALSAAQEEALLAALAKASKAADVIAVSDQLASGVVTPRVRAALCALARDGKRVIVDSREHIADFAGCIVKPNELESARAARLSPAAVTPEDYLPVAETLRAMTGADAIITMGSQGALCACADGVTHALPQKVAPPVDIVGAGDSFLSACALALGAGAALGEAAALGNLASAVTIQKLGQTGTASAEEIIKQFGGKNNAQG